VFNNTHKVNNFSDYTPNIASLNTEMKNFFSSLFNFFSTPWWVKITTAEPNCIYYFGPFNDESEAEQAKFGYIEDLQNEGAQQIKTTLQQSAEPEELTIEYGVSPMSSVTVSV